MSKIVKVSLVTLVILLILDFVWIGLIANGFYKTEYGPLYTAHPVLLAASFFYIIYAIGLAHFAIVPALESRSLWRAVGSGAFLALIAFGTYDLTSLAITTNWPLLLTVVDMSWGVFEGAVASGVAFFLASRFFKMR